MKYPACALVSVAAAGCGAPGEEESTAAQPIRKAKLTVPAASECSPEVLATKRAPDKSLVPKPGKYTYKLTGARTVLGSDRTKKPLPRREYIAVSRPRKVGNLMCYRLHQTLTRDIEDTATFVVRGDDLYMTKLELRMGGELLDIRPSQPALSFDAENLSWSGSFKASTSFRYRVTILGRRKVRVGNRSYEAVGMEVVAKYNGDLNGTERAVRWLLPKHGIVAKSTVTQERFSGLDRFVLRYRDRLTSIHPK